MEKSLFIYQVEDGGAGFVEANNPDEAIQKVRYTYWNCGADNRYSEPENINIKILDWITPSMLGPTGVVEIGYKINIEY